MNNGVLPNHIKEIKGELECIKKMLQQLLDKKYINKMNKTDSSKKPMGE